MNKTTYRLIQQAWMKFDRSTALGCAQKNIPYDREKCKFAWDNYNNVLESCGHTRITHNSPFV